MADYTPPAGAPCVELRDRVAHRGTTDTQKAQIGSDLAAKITFLAQCDNYHADRDRKGLFFFVAEPKGQMPTPMDARTEIVRFITPFSDFTEGAAATHV